MNAHWVCIHVSSALIVVSTPMVLTLASLKKKQRVKNLDPEIAREALSKIQIQENVSILTNVSKGPDVGFMSDVSILSVASIAPLYVQQDGILIL